MDDNQQETPDADAETILDTLSHIAWDDASGDAAHAAVRNLVHDKRTAGLATEAAYRTVSILAAYVAVLVRRNGGTLTLTKTELDAAQGCAVQSSVTDETVTLIAPRVQTEHAPAIEVVHGGILTPEKIRMLQARRRMTDG